MQENICPFCLEPVFADDRPAGSVRRQSGLVSYHIDCLQKIAPQYKFITLDALAIHLFGDALQTSSSVRR